MDFQNDCTGERNEKYQVIPRVDEGCGLNVCVGGMFVLEFKPKFKSWEEES